MNLIIIGQDKKSIWDFSQCYMFIPNDGIHEIFIKPYSASNGISIATYKDPKRTEAVFNEIINVFSKSKLLLTPKARLPLTDIEAAKKYLDKLNNENFIVLDKMFNITPISNNYTLTYQLPEDVEII